METENWRNDEGEKPYKRALVFIIGGATQSEVMMLNKMGELFFEKSPFTYQIHVGSTDIITGTRLIQQICPTLKQFIPTQLRVEEPKQKKSKLANIFKKSDEKDEEQKEQKAKEKKEKKEKKREGKERKE